ncbi:hypothetical protein D3C71_364940 [compost metagenome]
MASTTKDTTKAATVKPAAAAKPAVKKPAAKPAAKKPAVKPTTEAKPARVKPGPKPGAKAAAAKPAATAAAKPASKSFMELGKHHQRPDGGAPEVGSYASQPKAAPMGAGRMATESGRSGNVMAALAERARETLGSGEAFHIDRDFPMVDPSAATELLTNLHRNETARMVLGQALSELRRLQVAQHQMHTGDAGYNHSRERTLMTFAQSQGITTTAYVVIDGKVLATSQQFTLTEESIKFDLETVPFSFAYYVHNPAYPEALDKYTGVVIDRADLEKLEKAMAAQDQFTRLQGEKDIAARLKAERVTFKRGDRLRSLINPKEVVLVLEQKDLDVFQTRTPRFDRSQEVPSDLIVIEVSTYRRKANEEAEITIQGSPRYAHSSMFELFPFADPLTLLAPNADFDGDALNMLAK